jgi:hypothetical protein
LLSHPEPIDQTAHWLDQQLAGRPLPALLVVIGLGHGHLLEVLERRGGGTRVLAFEPDPATARAFLARRDRASWRTSGRLLHLVGPDYAGADEAWRMFPLQPDDHILVVDPAVARADREGALGAARLLKRIVFGVRANAEARRQFAPRYLTNAIRNAPALVEGSDVRALTDFYRGVPAVIAAAGPSLDRALDDLREVSDRAVLIAVDTALRPLLDVGLTPALVIGMDPSARNARHLRSLPDCRDVWLVAESALDPSAVSAFDDRTFWFRVADHQPWPWYRELGIDVGRIDVWGSVVTAAFQVAILAGCDPIVLVGADFAYTDGRPYARGTTYELDCAYAAAIGDDPGRAWQMQMAMFEPLRVPDVCGTETMTTAPLQAFRDWMVAHAARCGRRVINATGAGIFFGDGVEQSTLRAALPTRRDIPSLRSIVRREPAGVSRSALAAQFRDVQRRADERSTVPVAQWAEFSGDGYDAAAIGDALESAARALETPERRVTRHADANVSALSARSQGAESILTQLPEANARLRAVLNGVVLPPALDAAGTAEAGHEAVALAGALELAGPLDAALQQFVEDPSAPLAREGLGRMPVSGLCMWPDEIAWPMRLFEALLGRACASSWPGVEDSFFSRWVVCRDSDAVRNATLPAALERADLSREGERLALEWLTCASQLGRWPASAFARVRGLLRAFEDGARSADGAHPESDGVDLVLGAQADGKSWTVDLSLRLDQAFLARALTGMVTLAGTEPHGPGTSAAVSPAIEVPGTALMQLAQIAAHGVSRKTDVGLVTIAPRLGARHRESLLLTPRVLTDEGVARSVLGYTTTRGAVFVPLLGHESVLVRESGSIEPQWSWPRSITGELPCGIDGAVAWTNWPETGPSYVMYRAAAHDAPRIQELPFRPTVGAWWRDRLYWTAFPSGLGSWAPGEEPVLSLPDLTLLAIHPDETGLLLVPCLRDEQGAPRRQRRTEGWMWRPGGPLEPVPLGSDGAASCRASDRGWTALAHPEADVVRLESDRGHRLSMTCYYPFTTAWAGTSLVVATIQGEILLFEDLVGALEGWLETADGDSPQQL